MSAREPSCLLRTAVDGAVVGARAGARGAVVGALVSGVVVLVVVAAVVAVVLLSLASSGDRRLLPESGRMADAPARSMREERKSGVSGGIFAQEQTDGHHIPSANPMIWGLAVQLVFVQRQVTYRRHSWSDNMRIHSSTEAGNPGWTGDIEDGCTSSSLECSSSTRKRQTT